MDIFDIELVVIQETEDVIRSRLMSRGETFTKSIEKGMERMKNLAKRAVFTGTSSEVLEFLTNYCRSVSPE
jgi:ribose 1,5-bisphosphokinase PhnN